MKPVTQETLEYHNQTAQQTLAQFGSCMDGLSEDRAGQLLSEVGPNELIEQNRRRAWHIFFEQLTSTMELILIAAAILSITMGSYRDASAILAIVILFAVLGFLQDYRAEKAMAALKKLAVPLVRTLRGGKVAEISARNLVPGDVILIEAGNIIPADCRLLQSMNLKIQESALTGESEPSHKEAQDVCPVDKPLAERSNMAFMGTIVAQGRASAVVIGTGMKTELGKIASILQGVRQTGTPLQRRLDALGKTLAMIGIAISVLIVIFGLWRGEKLSQLILAGISVAVAVIPEGLPAVVTITLALGAQRMLKRKSLIRKLPAVETLGSVTVICSDKTGTLTQNKMSVVCLDLLQGRVEFQPEIKDNSQATFLLTAVSLCNDAIMTGHEEFVGDPTEGALLVAAYKIGLQQETQQKQLPRIAEIPFDSERKRMTTIHRVQDDGLPCYIPLKLHTPAVAFVKGSADGLLDICAGAIIDSRPVAMTPEIRRQIQQSNEQLASSGFRVLGAAYKPMPLPVEPLESKTIEKDLIFVGLIGMMDPPRTEVKQSVSLCKSAGIRPIMITGDHPLTARYIADQIGILNHGNVMTGVELEKTSVEQLQTVVQNVSVYARVSPEHKLKIIDALQKKGHIVAMTGDGVNDAPALKQADIGVAMGITGTDVSKEASDMVLLDDNFSTIVSAVEEGRIVYDNIRKFVKFSVAGNIGKVIVMLIGPFIFDKLPLLPLQLLWLNLLTDGLLGLALGMEKAESNIMQRPPVNPKEGVFGNGGWAQVFIMGTAIGLLSTGIGYWYYCKHDSTWQTMIFLMIGFCQVWQMLTARSEKDSFMKAGLFSNPTAIWMMLLVIVLQLAAVFVPAIRGYLSIEQVGFAHIGIILAAGMVVLAVGEIRKKNIARR